VSTPFRCQIRLVLSDLDRNVFAQRTVAMAQFPDEPDQHVLLRFLAWVWFYDEALQDGQGFLDQTQADLWAQDLTGALTLWIECGPPPLKRLCKALGRSRTARFIALCGTESEARDLRKALRAERPRHLDRVELYFVDSEFLDWLESHGRRNMDWTATLSDGTLYLDCDGHTHQCLLHAVAVA